MSSEWIRIWKEEDFSSISKALILIGEGSSDCGNCRHLGIEYSKVSKCPSCGVTFRYAGLRSARSSGDRLRWVRKIRQDHPDWTIIEYEDFKSTMDRKKARDIFSD